MGKRKSKAKPPPKKVKVGLPSTFTCLFCNHENSITVKMEKKTGTGELSCKTCGQQFQTGINSLSDPVDVYSDWVDACDAVAKEAAGVSNGAELENDAVGPRHKAAPPTTDLVEDEEEVDPEADSNE